MSNEPEQRKEEEVAQLRRLEHASRDGSDLHTCRHAIAALHWRLARIVGNSAGGGHSVAA